MKIVSWNLKNLSLSKLKRPVNPKLAVAGVGNNGLEYIVGALMGDPVWKNVTSLAPVDIFVIIELRSGGNTKGAPVSGNAMPTVAAIGSAMNLKAPAGYHYTGVPPLVTGRGEGVAILYNDQRLTMKEFAVDRDALGRYLNPRTPYRVAFDVKAGGTLVILGVHAPPPRGGTPTFFREPIQYCNWLPDITSVSSDHDICVLGDFNCNPGSTYLSKAGAVAPFINMTGYKSNMPPASLTSMRKTYVATLPPPRSYLNQFYDNVLFKFPSVPTAAPKQYAMDLVGGNPLFATKPKTVFNGYWKVSDHLPVVLEI